MKKKGEINLLFKYLIIFCLIFIQLTPIATITHAEEGGESPTPNDADKNTTQEAANPAAEGIHSPTAIQENFNDYPPLLITEISPDSVGTDDYEFFEVYNNTNQPLSLNNYLFHYVYTDGSNADKAFPIPENTVIQPQQTLVFWFNSQGKAPADFNAFFNTNLPEEQIISYKDIFPGFANGGNRGLAIKNKAGQTIVSASYLPGETGAGKVVHYQYPKTNTEMDKLATAANPTPGIFETSQVPATPVNLDEIPEDLVGPVIEHTPVTDSDAYKDIMVEANVTDDLSVPYATLYYKKEADETFTSLAMNVASENPAHFTVTMEIV